MSWEPKDPEATVDYDSDWTDELAAVGGGAVLAGATWSIATGLTKVSESFTDTVAKVWLSGGALGEEYDCTVTVTYAGRTNQRTYRLLVQDKVAPPSGLTIKT